MAKKKKDKSIELISKTIIEPGTDKEPIAEEKKSEVKIVSGGTGDLSSLLKPKGKSLDELNASLKPKPSISADYTQVLNYLQQIYDLGYADGAGGDRKKTLKMDENGHLYKE